MPDALRPHGLYSPWNSPGQNTGVGSLSLLQGNLPNPGIEPKSPTLQADSLPAKPPGKPKNPGVGSLSLLQGIFQTQKSNHVSCMTADSLPTEPSSILTEEMKLRQDINERLTRVRSKETQEVGPFC